ncbi:MCE family protein [Hoyosella subflava]|uniref:Putative Mce family protein n=1 Tax=Hoyosella subflava (strain DSM 45089 / JCM 17490 / NBRC 109087 / DQS3-9A1) TaxID=443218 RepID=F6EN31_HOYSD|nr:MCE family protein [Hoyosella subflava]AEF39348.1 Putative Mce family protein [Hoyosella subflava DQS3-9A1]
MSVRKPMRPEIKGIIGIVVTIVIVVAALQFDNIPLFRSEAHYTANFADAGGLLPGDPVEVAGVKVGEVDTVELDFDKVLVSFTANSSLQFGDRTSAAIKTNTILGRKSLHVLPEGRGTLSAEDTIPLDRTTSPYSLNDALGDLSTTVHDLDTDQLATTFDAMADSLTDTPPHVRAALDGVSRLSESIAARNEELLALLASASTVTGVLDERADQINSLLVDGNQLLYELDLRRSAISELITNTSALAQQLTGLVRDNEQQMGPTLERLNSVLALLRENDDNLKRAIDGLAPYSLALGEQVGSGPYFQAYVSNFGSGKLLQGLVDALVWPENVPNDLRHYLLEPPPSIEIRDGER